MTLFKTNTMKKAAIIALASLAMAPYAMAELSPYSASYHTTYDRFSAKTKVSLKKDAESGLFTYSSRTKPRGFAALLGKIKESVKFNLDNGQITPQSYRHSSRDDISIDYDWATKTVKSNDDGKKKDLILAGGELDLLSMQMQVMEDLNNGQLKNSYTIIKDNAFREYAVEKVAEEDITIAKKTYKTIKLKQQRKGSSRTSYLWLAPDLQHTVVRMEQYKGKKLRGTLSLTGYKLIEEVKK